MAKDAKPARPVEIFYNSACPVCRGGIDASKRMLGDGAEESVCFLDMTASPEALAADRVTLDQVRRHVYARDAQGTLHRGIDALAVLCRATPGLGWLGWLVTRPLVRPAARWCYDRFADRLYAWNRHHGRW